MYHILVAGAGYTGSRIASFFRQKNQKVTVIKKTDSGRAELEAQGIEVLIKDLTRPEGLKVPPAHFIVISLAPAGRESGEYAKTYIDAVNHLLERIPVRPRLVVYLSSSGVYGPQEGWVDESTEPAPDSERSRILLAAERNIFASGFPTLVLRLAGIYGPGRNRLSQFRDQQWPKPHPDHYLNMIHVEDIVQAMPCLFKKGEDGKVYLGVDDRPELESDFYAWLNQRLGLRCPDSLILPSNLHGKRLSNQRLKSLGFSFLYPDFRSGYESLLSLEKSLPSAE